MRLSSPFLGLFMNIIIIKYVFSWKGKVWTNIRGERVSFELVEGAMSLCTPKCEVRIDRDLTVSFQGNENDLKSIPLLDLAINAYQKAECGEHVFVIDESNLADHRHPLFVTKKSCISENSRHLVEIQQAIAGEEVDWCTEDAKVLGILPRALVHEFNLIHRGIGVLVFNQESEIFVHKRSSTKRLFPSMIDMFVGGVSSAGESSVATLLRELDEELNLDFVTVSPSAMAAVSKRSKKEKRKSRDVMLSADRSEAERAAYLAVKNDILERIFGEGSSDMEDKNDQQAPFIRFLGRTTIQTSYNHCIVDTFAAVCSEEQAKGLTFKDGECESGSFVHPSVLATMLEGSGRDKFVPDGLQIWDTLSDMI